VRAGGGRERERRGDCGQPITGHAVMLLLRSESSNRLALFILARSSSSSASGIS
jgi:hypothetical protein